VNQFAGGNFRLLYYGEFEEAVPEPASIAVAGVALAAFEFGRTRVRR
jgi:PEP-CTERM motif